MLRFLQIRDYAIVDSLNLDLAGGFTCITGETGAGKSILVGALGLLCGDRADTSAIRGGADKAELTAEFDLPPDSPARAWLREAALDDDGHCLLRRMISDAGRSRAWINGTAVTLQQLAELGERLVEIHGQNEHLRLVHSEEQFRLLDGGGHYADALTRLERAFEAWRSLDDEQRALQGEQPLDAGDRELLEYQVRELESDLLPATTFAELETEHRMLTRGGEVLMALEEAAEALDADGGGAARVLHRTAERLERHAALDPDVATARNLMREAAINCDEALNSLQAALARLDLSPERLEVVERQLSTQHDLARKHRAQPEALAEVLERLRERLERAATLDARLTAIDRDLQRALADYRTAAREVHAQRARRAVSLAAAVTELMQQLGMAGGRFDIEVRFEAEATPSVRGSDRLELLVSANPGTPPGPLRKVASGGELSRISLAIKVASRTTAAATQVFDEVDAGIGGETAHAVGALIRSLARDGQALCVTHLAQVAVFADQQVQVQKTSQDDVTRVTTSVLAEGDRVDEIARMLGGRLSAQSRAHASELLATASTQH